MIQGDENKNSGIQSSESQKTEHSPLPWSVVDRRRAPLPNIIITSADETHVAEAKGVHTRDPMLRFRWKPEEANAADARATANAEFIVRACNAHDALVAGLTAIAEKLEKQKESGTWRSLGEGWRSLDGHWVRELALAARAALTSVNAPATKGITK